MTTAKFGTGIFGTDTFSSPVAPAPTPAVHELDPIEEWMRVIFKWYLSNNPHW